MRFTPVCLGFFGLIALGSAESEQVSLGSSVETTTNTLTKRTFCLPFIGCYGSVDTTTDDQNCGNSKINCQKLSYPNGANGICENSVCGPSSCNAGFSLNPNTRTCQQINTASDVNNCGSFGNKCSPFANAQGVQCLAGRCAPLTPNPGYAFDPASRQCLSVNNDLNNCGRLGNVCSFPRGYGTCNSGVCTLQGCNTGSYNIGGQCTAISVQSDVKNCGAPGKICSFPNAQASCVNGQCQQGDCLDGYSATSVVTGYTLFVFPQYSTQCSKINFQTDPQNCGGAGVQCAASYVNGGAGQCVNGQCTASCDSGHDWDPLGFFCRPVTADVNNCGRCGQKCSFPNGSSQCVNGQCSLTSCNPGFNKINGQCVSLNLQSDVNNCGAQGKICAFANGGGVCANGQCTTTTCAQNFQLLAGKCVPMNLQSDVKNCGAVGASCPSTIGSPVCNSGNCGYSSCNSPYILKDGQCNLVNLQTDAQNCGALNKICPNKADGSQAQCVAGQCQLNCAPGTTYDPRDNFCRPTTSDPGNCGGIGIFCDTLAGAYSASCINSVCTATRCYDDYVLVKGQCQQINVNTDVNNCGTKGRVCPTFANGASSICEAGICKAASCNPGYVWDGRQCVSKDTYDLNNCGSAGFRCNFFPNGATGICSAGKCVVQSCPAGFFVNAGAGICQLINASQLPKSVKRSLATEKKTLCPKDETACPILGSATYEQALNHHFSDMNKFSSGIMAGEGGYECLDTQQSLESCGGCASTGEGRDCTAIPAALGVGCDAGTCVVFSCKSGYRPSLDGQKCIKATHLTKRNYNHTSSKTLPRRHSHNSRALPLNHGK